MDGRQTRRTFSPEFKLARVRQVLDGDESTASVARQYQLNDNLLFKWISEYRSNALWVVRAQPFVPVVIQDTPVGSPLSSVQPAAEVQANLILKSGHRLELSGLDPQRFRALIELLT